MAPAEETDGDVKAYVATLKEKATAYGTKREGLVEKATDVKTTQCFERADLDVEIGMEEDGDGS